MHAQKILRCRANVIFKALHLDGWSNQVWMMLSKYNKGWCAGCTSIVVWCSASQRQLKHWLQATSKAEDFRHRALPTAHHHNHLKLDKNTWRALLVVYTEVFSDNSVQWCEPLYHDLSYFTRTFLGSEKIIISVPVFLRALWYYCYAESTSIEGGRVVGPGNGGTELTGFRICFFCFTPMRCASRFCWWQVQSLSNLVRSCQDWGRASLRYNNWRSE